MKDMNAERLKQIAEKRGKLTAEEKRFIEETCKELGVDFNPKTTKCSDCYKDAAVQCYGVLAARNTEENTEESTGRAYVLKQGVDVVFGTTRVNAATLTDDLAEWLLSRGFDKDFFAVCK